MVKIRDAGTEAFLRGIAHPLFRAAGVDPALVRITLVQARPINAFVTSGNRMFVNNGLIRQSGSVAELAGVLAQETGHIAGGHNPEALSRGRCRPARHARAIAQYRSGRTDQAVALPAEQSGNPWLRELRGRPLFETAHPREPAAPLREAGRLAPAGALIRAALGRALMEAGDPALLPAAAGKLDASLRIQRDDAFTWRQLGIVQGRRGLEPQVDLALMEEAILDGDFPKARSLARQAEEALPPNPLKLRAQDLREAARRDNLPQEQREQDDAMRRRQPR